MYEDEMLNVISRVFECIKEINNIDIIVIDVNDLRFLLGLSKMLFFFSFCFVDIYGKFICYD